MGNVVSSEVLITFFKVFLNLQQFVQFTDAVDHAPHHLCTAMLMVSGIIYDSPAVKFVRYLLDDFKDPENFIALCFYIHFTVVIDLSDLSDLYQCPIVLDALVNN